MNITGTTATSGSTTAAGTEAVKEKDPMGRDMFLQLLITQLQHQDPLQPQENGEFLAQLAQFSSLENLTQIKDDMAALRAALEGNPLPSSSSTASAPRASTSTTTSVPPGTLVDPSTVSNVYVAPGF